MEAGLAECTAEKERLSAERDWLQQLYKLLLREVQEERARLEERVQELSAVTLSEVRAEAQERITRLQQELEAQTACNWDLEESCRRLQSEAKRQRDRTELECCHAAETERRKWETCEEQLSEQVQDLRRQCQATGGDSHTVSRGDDAFLRTSPTTTLREVDSERASSNSTTHTLDGHSHDGVSSQADGMAAGLSSGHP